MMSGLSQGGRGDWSENVQGEFPKGRGSLERKGERGGEGKGAGGAEMACSVGGGRRKSGAWRGTGRGGGGGEKEEGENTKGGWMRRWETRVVEGGRNLRRSNGGWR